MNAKLTYLLASFILLSTSIEAESKMVTIEDIYREMKIFETKTEERFKAIDNRFEQVDKRFEQVNKRFDDLINFLWIISGIFTTIMVFVIGFAYWDRNTTIRKAKEETIKDIETNRLPAKLLKALQELAKNNKKLAEILRQFNLL